MKIQEEPKIMNAVIESVTLDTGDRNLLTAWLHLDYGNGEHQGFGGFILYLPKSYRHHALLSHAGHFIFRCMEIAGAESWEKMKGKTIRVKCKGDSAFSREILAIGHIVKNDWFSPSQDFSLVNSDTTDKRSVASKAK